MDSEPHRLSFGTPATVQAVVADRVKSCWFAEGGVLPAGFSFQLAPKDGDENGGGPRLIRIYDESAGHIEAFQVHFYPYNDNTLISTRNLSLPEALARELQVSIETWLLDENRCPSKQIAAEQAPAAPLAEAPADTRLHAAGPAAAPPLAAGERLATAAPEKAVKPDGGDEDLHTAELKARGAID